MPRYYEDKEQDGRACSGVREDLRQCLLESPCVLRVLSWSLSGTIPWQFNASLPSHPVTSRMLSRVSPG
ncbi:cytochrome c oxidase assembly factor 5-like protein [Willisornis vidua]|uniref:Cytochrome c oxidase assembly factor 5-like protein n=1 Tax=Willisornis vidua TaxID=1566151 RepID=A0ABQ9DVC7_9PASS|nr:cytochrome c oxidase assembly factor 5-like protein [Willisornis vidua]